MLTVLILLYLLQCIAAILIALHDARRPAKALVWVLISVFLPVLGLAAYAALTRPVRSRHAKATTADELAQSSVSASESASTSLSESVSASTSLSPEASTAADNLAQVSHISHVCAVTAEALTGLGCAPILPAQVSILQNGRATYRELFAQMQKARVSIDVEYYIFREDDIGQEVLNLLIQKAGEGVHVRFLRDGFGSKGVSRTVIHRLQAAGVQTRIFFPLRFPEVLWTWNHRDHCKIVVIDNHVAFTGGINVGDEYIHGTKKYSSWRDTHVHIEGPATVSLREVFEMNWQLGRADAPVEHGARASVDALTATTGIPKSRQMDKSLLSGGNAPDPGETRSHLTECLVQVVQGGPDSRTQQIPHVFFAALSHAERSIELTTPYFIPDRATIMALQSAAARGVRVRLQVPARPDHKLVGLASRTYYPDLVLAGIEVYLYTAGLLHSKVLVVDETLSVVGAANLDNRSLRLNYEVCAVLYGTEPAKFLTKCFLADLAHARKLSVDVIRQGDVGRSGGTLAERAARILSPLL